MSGIKNIKKKLKGFQVRPPNVEVLKKVLLHIPYVVVFYVVNKCTWLYQYCRGSTVVDRLMVLFMNYPLAFKKLLPSIQPKSLAAGTIAAVSVWAVVYFKGKNGKKFKIYKFRSMYMDAEARKAELMKQNRVADGKMFKLDFDPRVIGNKILPDGTKKTGIGNFIRVTSLDEFPQFFNVLKGDMSLVGTRPPLPGEVSEYEIHHRARLAIKPGITGMWQVSGRSDITDFEEVVRLDTKYIKEWTPALDIKILFKTVKTVRGKEGSM